MPALPRPRSLTLGRSALSAIVLAVLWASVQQALAAEKFTVVFLPDPQHYSYHPGVGLYNRQCRWIRDNKTARNIKHAVWLGDLTNGNTTDQWTVASAAFDILDTANIAYGVVPGNHDYLGSGSNWKVLHDRILTKFNGSVGPSRFSGKSWWGGCFAGGHNENNYTFFSAGGLDFMVICLEYAPRKDVLTWANNLIRSHPNHRVIIATHAYLNPGGSYSSSCGPDYGMVGSRGVDLFDECASRHSNVFLVVNGHVQESLHQTKYGVCGNRVYEMVVDYQGEKLLGTGDAMGNGWLRLLEFDPNINQINVSTLSVASGDPTIFVNGVDRFYDSSYNADPNHVSHKWTWSYNMGVGEPYLYLNDDTEFHDRYVNRSVGGAQQDPDIAQAANGNWAGVWESDGNGDGIYGVSIRWFDADGNELFGDVSANTLTDVSATNPAVAMTPDGRAVVVFQSASNAIYMRCYNANGTPVGSAQQLVTSTTVGTVRDPDVAIDDNGRFVVVWEDDADGNGYYQVRARGFDFDYSQRFPAKDVNSIAAGQQTDPAIAMAANGDYVVAWQDDQDSDGVPDVAVRGFLANETQRFVQKTANTTTVGLQADPDVAIDDTGRFVVVWEDDADLNGSHQIKARGFSATGSEIIPEMTVNQVATGDQISPAIAMNTSSNWFVVWEDSSTGEGYQIMSQQFSIAGARVFTDDVRVNTVDAVDHDSGSPRRRDPVVSAHQSGRYTCAWADDMDGDGDFDVLARGVPGRAVSVVVKAYNATVDKSPLDVFYKRGSSVSLSVTPNEGYSFVQWQGDVPAGSEHNNPLTIVLDSDKHLTAVSARNPFQVAQRDSFTTDCRQPAGSPTGWSPIGQTSATLVGYDWDGANSALRARVFTSATNPVSAYRYRSAGWVANQSEWLPYAAVGTSNYVRVKYWMYATGMANPANLNQIPNFRLRAATRYAVTSQFECLHHDVLSDPGNLNWAHELRPSTDPAKSSLYRVDLDPVDVPYLQANGGFEGILRGFDAFALQPQDNGWIAMAESTIGTYPAALLDNTLTAPLQVYQPSASDAGNLKVYNSAAELQLFNYVFPAGTVEGQFPNQVFTGVGSYRETTAGVTLDTSNVSSNEIGIVTRDFNPDRETFAYGTHPRVEEGKQYKIQFHITSTQQSNRNAPLWLRSRSIKFAWSQKLELGGPYSAGNQNNAIAQQVLPGIGCANPDKSYTGEPGGWYTMILHSPMSSDIRPEFAPGTPLATRMPKISSEPGPGVAASSKRDIRFGVDLVDTLDYSANAKLEKGNYTIDYVSIRAYDLIQD